MVATFFLNYMIEKCLKINILPLLLFIFSHSVSVWYVAVRTIVLSRHGGGGGGGVGKFSAANMKNAAV